MAGGLRSDCRSTGRNAFAGESEPVRIARCFPWTEPGRYFSLRNGKDEELLLVRDIDELDEPQRAALSAALAEAGLVLEVIRVDASERDFELRNWSVMTRQGPRQFQTKLEDWPRHLPGGGLLITDVAGDLFHVPDPHALDEKSQKRLWAFTD
jgi:hypothetical protein